MGSMSRLMGAAALAALLAAPVLAQQAAPSGAEMSGAGMQNPAPDEPDAVAAPTGEAGPADPHLKLPALTGGPDGSPTALRGNPLPGTSTSIPTANPAPVPPLPERQGQAAEQEDTGIEGQCDPVVSVGCPTLAVPDAAAPPASPGAGATGAPAN